MKPPILGIARGKHITNQKRILKEIANSSDLEMKIISWNRHGLDDLIFYVIDHHWNSVCFFSVAQISKTFLFYLRFIYEVQLAGIEVFVVNEIAQPPAFREINKAEYRQLWETFGGDWQDLELATIWKSYYPDQSPFPKTN